MITIDANVFYYVLGFISCLILLIIIALISFFKDTNAKNRIIQETIDEIVQEIIKENKEQGNKNDTNI